MMLRSIMTAALVLAVTAAPASAALFWMPGYHAEVCQDFTTAKGAGVACADDVVLLTGSRLNYDDVVLGRFAHEAPLDLFAAQGSEGLDGEAETIAYTELANGRAVEHQGSTLRLPWASRSALEVWIAAYGPLSEGTFNGLANHARPVPGRGAPSQVAHHL